MAITHHNIPRGVVSKAVFWVLAAVAGAIIVAFVLYVGLVFHSKGNEVNNRIRCAQNLARLGKAMIMYADDNDHRFVRTYFVRNTLAAMTYQNGPADNQQAASANPFRTGTTQINNTAGSIFWLMRHQHLPASVFICPSSDAVPDVFPGTTPPNDPRQRGNWNNITQNLSYSMSCPYNGTDIESAKYKWGATLYVDFPILADINPGGDVAPTGNSPSVVVDDTSPPEHIRYANSPNHGRDGQNVLFADGHVLWTTSPIVGKIIWGHRDNIYTASGYVGDAPISQNQAAGSCLTKGPRNQDDSVMYPTAQ